MQFHFMKIRYSIEPEYRAYVKASGFLSFVLSFENEIDRTSHSNYYFPKVETKYYNVMIDGKNLFYQPINSELIT